MIEIQLSDVLPLPFDPEHHQKYAFLGRYHDRSAKDGKITQSLFWDADDLASEAVAYHQNYLRYLELCWGIHHGIVVSPDILWYTLLCELVSLIATDVEFYRPLFSASQEKQMITVDSAGRDLPLEMLLDKLKSRIPSRTDLFLPRFSTTTTRSRHAMAAAFCDLVAPYYSYAMVTCNFPAIRVYGSAEDWEFLATSWNKLWMACFRTCPSAPWFEQVHGILLECSKRREDASHWKDMFELRRCGSGSPTVDGWITQLFRQKPRRGPVISGYPSGVSSVDYTAEGESFRMRDGLFYSTRDGDFLLPDFGSLRHRVVLNMKPETFSGWGDRNDALQRFLERTGQQM